MNRRIRKIRAAARSGCWRDMARYGTGIMMAAFCTCALAWFPRLACALTVVHCAWIYTAAPAHVLFCEFAWFRKINICPGDEVGWADLDRIASKLYIR